MDRVGGFDPWAGITPLRDGATEIGRGNLPESRRLLPGDVGAAGSGDYLGAGTDSGLMERFGPYLAMEVTHRELLSPDVFFASLEEAAEGFVKQAGQDGVKDGPLVDAAQKLAEVLGDRALCEALRNLVVRA